MSGIPSTLPNAAYKSSISERRASVAVIQAISDCAQDLADREGMFARLVTVSPNRDNFTIELLRRTKGDEQWGLELLSPKTEISCDDDKQNASPGSPISILLPSTTIHCIKNPDTRVSLAVKTTAGKTAYFEIYAVKDELNELHEDIQSAHAEIRALRAETNAQFSRLDVKIRRLEGQISYLDSQLQRQTVFGGEYVTEDPCHQPVDKDNSIPNPLTNQLTCPSGFTPNKIGRFRASEFDCGVTQFVCQKQGIN